MEFLQGREARDVARDTRSGNDRLLTLIIPVVHIIHNIHP
jgi:hypothetical protein